MPKKTKATPKPSEASDDLGSGFLALATAVDGIAEELRPLYKIEDLNDNLAGIASSIHDLANATKLSLIAKHGSDGDRARVVAWLKGDFPALRIDD